MKTHNKITILLMSVVFVLLAISIGYQYIRHRELDLYYQSSKISDRMIISKVMEFHTKSYANPVVDNAAWDGMVEFTESRDTNWAKENMGSTFATFNMGYFAAFDTNGNVIYEVLDSETASVSFSPSDVASWFDEQRTVHHFYLNGNKILELFGCVIVPTADQQLITKEKGYLIAGVEWNQEQMAALEKSTGFSIVMTTVLLENPSTTGDTSAMITRHFKNAEGKTIATLTFSAERPFEEELLMLRNIAILGLVIVILTYFLFFILTNKWIAKPLRAITKSLSESSIKPIYYLLGRKGSYGDIARLIRMYNEQKVALLIEVEERKNAEQKVVRLNESLEERVKKRTEEVKRTLSEQEALSYSVSHDLRSPLRAIDAFSNILLEDYGKQLDAEGIRGLESIRNNGIKMTRLIEGLIAFTQLNRVEVRPMVIDMKRMTMSILDDMIPTLDRAGYKIIIEDLPCVTADATLIKEVWVQLISNAVKFTQRLSLPEIVIGFERNQEKLIYFVRDNGIGFNMKYYNKLFGVFQRLHEDSEFSGTGIGLALVRRIVEIHGGCAWAEGIENEGATFYFSLPEKISDHNA